MIISLLLIFGLAGLICAAVLTYYQEADYPPLYREPEYMRRERMAAFEREWTPERSHTGAWRVEG